MSTTEGRVAAVEFLDDDQDHTRFLLCVTWETTDDGAPRDLPAALHASLTHFGTVFRISLIRQVKTSGDAIDG